MPTYSYECNNCGHTCDIFQSITADPKKDCPKCKKSSLKRLIGGGAGFIFKGSGFYITDYRSKEYKEKAESEQNTDKPSKADKQSKTETKSNDKKNSGNDTKKSA